MPLNYNLFPEPPSDTVTDPQGLFQALPGRARKLAYLRDVQGDVLAKWFEAPDKKDTVIKMNTGGGKTIVGLLILKSSLNAGLGPAVYIAPDHYLCDQVAAEAASLGLTVTDDPRSISYQTGKAILIIPLHTLVNGLSRFGVGNEVRIEIGSIVIDDAHACLSVAETQFTLTLARVHPAFIKLFQLFREDLRTQSPTTVVQIETNDPQGLVPVPYWAWEDKQESVMRILAEYRDDNEIKFARPLLGDELSLCRCIFSASKLEISPPCLPIEAIPAFARARRRVYMTATLADESILVTDFGADADAATSPISPRTASDLGDRMILVPQAINADVSDEDIKQFLVQYKGAHNVVVIVPSAARAEFWKDVVTRDLVLTADNLQAGVDRLRTSTGNLAVMVNKYDGIDLPDDTCRILVLDGLPDTRRLIDRLEQAILRATQREQVRQVQRIEQGMGRAIRSNEDHCVVILMGRRLISYLYSTGAAALFSTATARQLNLSGQVAEQISKQGLAAMAEPMADLLERNPEWVAAARGCLVDVTYSARGPLDTVAVAQRSAFDFARRRRFDEAQRALRVASEEQSDKIVKGWLLAQVAAYVHPLDAATSQTVLLAANDLNGMVTKPLAGIGYVRLSTIAMNQAREAASHLSKYSDANSMVVAVNGLLSTLVFQEDTAEEFEQALKEIGQHLGFRSQRPEKEKLGNLDVLWGLGELRYLLLPCKNGATSPTISKRYTDEVAGALNWFRGQYDSSCQPFAAIIHPSPHLDIAATAPPEMRVISERELARLRDAIRGFANAVKDRRNDPEHIRLALSSNGLLGSQFIDRHTIPPKAPPARR